jgi:hypothetical protein
MMKVRKDQASLFIVIALISAGLLAEAKDPFKLQSINKSSFSRTRGDPLKHEEPHVLLGKSE